MTLTINGDAREVAEGMLLGDLLRELTVRGDGTAVAVNGAVVPRAQHARTALHEGDVVEIIVAVAGG